MLAPQKPMDWLGVPHVPKPCEFFELNYCIGYCLCSEDSADSSDQMWSANCNQNFGNDSEECRKEERRAWKNALSESITRTSCCHQPNHHLTFETLKVIIIYTWARTWFRRATDSSYALSAFAELLDLAAKSNCIHIKTHIPSLEPTNKAIKLILTWFISSIQICDMILNHNFIRFDINPWQNIKTVS